MTHAALCYLGGRNWRGSSAAFPLRPCLVFCAFRVSSSVWSIHDRGVHELLEEFSIVGADRAWRLRHIHRDDLLLRVDPEIGSGVTTPHELALRAGHAGDARGLTHR